MTTIFNQYLIELNKAWDQRTPKLVRTRVKLALESLLPKETLDGVKRTCGQLVVSKVEKKVEQWRESNLRKIDCFSRDINADALKIASYDDNTISEHTNFLVRLKTPLPSDFFHNLQEILHSASLYPEKLDRNKLLTIAHQTRLTLNRQTFTSNIDRNCGWILLQLLQLVIANRVEILDDEVIQSFIQVWKLKKLQNFVTPCVKTTEEEREFYDGGIDEQRTVKVENYIFAHLISIRYILQLHVCENREKSFIYFSDVVINLLKEGLINLDIVTEQLVGLFKHEWTKVNYLNLKY